MTNTVTFAYETISPFVLPCGAVLGFVVARLIIETGRLLWRRWQDRREAAARLATVPLLRPRTLAETYALAATAEPRERA